MIFVYPYTGPYQKYKKSGKTSSFFSQTNDGLSNHFPCPPPLLTTNLPTSVLARRNLTKSTNNNNGSNTNGSNTTTPMRAKALSAWKSKKKLVLVVKDVSLFFSFCFCEGGKCIWRELYVYV